MGSTVSTLLLMLLFVALSGFFSASETAFSTLNGTRVKNMARGGDKGAQRVLKITEQYDKLLTTILVGNNLVNIGLTAVATVWFIELLGDAGSSVATAVVTVVVLIFGEITPKSFAREAPEAIAKAIAPVLRALMAVMTPVNWLFTQWKRWMAKLFHRDRPEVGVTEGEVLTLVDEASEDGGIDEEDKQLIRNIFEFDDITAGEVCTHRTELAMLRLEESDEDWEETLRTTDYAVYPVCGERVDDVEGVLYAREYFRLADKKRDAVLKNAVKPPYFVPETVRADVLFREMKRRRERCAIVVDEYGGVNGIVTLSDLLAQIVGEFDDNNGVPDEPDILQTEPGVWQIRGGAPLEDVADATGAALPIDEYDTFGGMALGALRTIPPDGARPVITCCGLCVHVLELKDRRLVRAEVRLAPPDAAAQPQNEA